MLWLQKTQQTGTVQCCCKISALEGAIVLSYGAFTKLLQSCSYLELIFELVILDFFVRTVYWGICAQQCRAYHIASESSLSKCQEILLKTVELHLLLKLEGCTGEVTEWISCYLVLSGQTKHLQWFLYISTTSILWKSIADSSTPYYIIFGWNWRIFTFRFWMKNLNLFLNYFPQLEVNSPCQPNK